MYGMLEVEAQDLLERQKELEAKKEKLGLVAPLYALWLLSEKVEDLLGLIEQHLAGEGCAPPIPPKPAVRKICP